jgi:hypothetical protein
VLGTVAWTAVAGSARAQAAAARATAARAGSPMPGAGWQAAAYRHALAVGFDRAFLVAATIAVLILVVAIVSIRRRNTDQAGS